MDWKLLNNVCTLYNLNPYIGELILKFRMKYFFNKKIDISKNLKFLDEKYFFFLNRYKPISFLFENNTKPSIFLKYSSNSPSYRILYITSTKLIINNNHLRCIFQWNHIRLTLFFFFFISHLLQINKLRGWGNSTYNIINLVNHLS